MNVPMEYDGNLSEQALATAQWANPSDVSALAHKPGALWLGRAADKNETAVGLADDRHALIVAGSRAGKGTSVIVPNLCLWPGSLVVIDPKGENASIAATRRAAGSEYCDGLEQRTYVLDPFKAAKVGDDLRASFNPLDALHPDDEEAVDDAARIADALVVGQSGSSDPFWDEQSRTLIKGLILHILTTEDFASRRNLVTIRQLVTSGDIATRKILENLGEEDIPSGFELLFEGMRRNPAFNGIVAGTGETFYNLAMSSPKTLSGILSAAGNHTEFIDSLAMQRVLQTTTPGLKLSRLKTDPAGVSLFLSLPQRFMNTHFRWLRMMTSLIVTEMERTVGKPATGHPVLLVLDEFAGLRKMDVIEHAAAQIAGFGVKMCFIVQNLTQLKNIYKDNWEVFVSNAGTRLFFGIEDNFSRDYISKQLGETEVIRTTRNRSGTRGTSTSYTTGSSSSQSRSTSSTSGGSSGSSSTSGNSHSARIEDFWGTYGNSSGTSQNTGTSWSSSDSSSSSTSESRSSTDGTNESETSGASQAIHKRPLLTPDEVGLLFSRVDDESNAAYPGLALSLASGRKPIIVRRTNYFDDLALVRAFDPLPEHPLKTIAKKATPKIIPPIPVPENTRHQLNSTYGTENTSKAYAIVESLHRDYPYLEAFKKFGPDGMAEKFLRAAVHAVKTAAADDRFHTVPESLGHIENHAKVFYSKDPNNIQDLILEYNDEKKVGRAAKAKKKKDRIETILYSIVLIIIISAYFN